MSEDLTNKLPKSDSEKLNLILITIKNLEVRFDKLEARVNNIDLRLQKLEKIVEERLYDTRPIWEKVVVDVGKLQEGQQRLEQGQERLEQGQEKLEQGQEKLQADVREIRTSQRDAFRRMNVLNDTLLAMQSDYRDIYDRVRGLELHVNPSNSST